MLGGIAGGGALAGALGGVLGGIRGQTAAPPPRQVHSLHDLHQAMKASYRGAYELDQLLSTQSYSGIAAAAGPRFENCRVETGPRPGIVIAAREMTLNEQLHADAIDDWDREFEDKTGALPPFSRLVPLRDAY